MLASPQSSQPRDPPNPLAVLSGLGRVEHGDAAAWLLLPQSEAPEQWRERAVLAVLIPLTQEELQAVTGPRAAVAPASDDDALVRLLISGATHTEMAAELGVSVRTVQRRIARLRRKMNARTTRQLQRQLRGSGVVSS